jgi:hypothetical protein
MIDPRHLPNTTTARLPENYLLAKDALRRCAKHFTPESYALATVALAHCAEQDECAAWPDRDALGAYARIADDDELRRLIRRVEQRRIKWKALNPDLPHE